MPICTGASALEDPFQSGDSMRMKPRSLVWHTTRLLHGQVDRQQNHTTRGSGCRRAVEPTHRTKCSLTIILALSLLLSSPRIPLFARRRTRCRASPKIVRRRCLQGCMCLCSEISWTLDRLDHAFPPDGKASRIQFRACLVTHGGNNLAWVVSFGRQKCRSSSNELRNMSDANE